MYKLLQIPYVSKYLSLVSSKVDYDVCLIQLANRLNLEDSNGSSPFLSAACLPHKPLPDIARRKVVHLGFSISPSSSSLTPTKMSVHDPKLVIGGKLGTVYSSEACETHSKIMNCVQLDEMIYNYVQ
jgi:hypothetical protein